MAGGSRAVDPTTRELEEERDFLLRSLADLEAEHDAADLDDPDYRALKDDYTARAAAVLRALEAPAQEAPPADPPPADAPPTEAVPADPSGPPETAKAGQGRAGWLSRHRRTVVSVAGVAIVVAGVLWAVVASSSQRQAGETISGQQVGATQPTNSSETKLLLAAQKAADRGDNVTELKDAQAVLVSDPTQPQALTMEGWLLAQTGQKALVAKGVGLLTLAERIDPGFAEPHVYRGIALLSEGENRSAVPELRWYLAHRPDPKLAPKVRAALAKAEAAIAGRPG
ncbi:MAG: hypothetical protein FWC87_03300 [Acidimicrobiaceae bacterium]|nr:hypothetical protein [Acidimicrobiaceae bacterium]